MKKNSDSQAKNNAPAKKHSSALAAAAQGRSATENVKPKATRDVNGSSGVRNTGTNVSYEDKE